MGYYSKLNTAVLELSVMGLSNQEIADRLEIAVDEVELIIEQELAYEHDGQPTEMEEWMSFDPDC
jgi:orotate phosphoribosyltransferase-like protein